MQKMSVERAADFVRGKLKDPSVALSATQRHQLAFARKVCAAAGRDPGDVVSMAEVMAILHDNGIENEAGNEYPKLATREVRGKTVPIINDDHSVLVWQSADEERAWRDANEPPKPAAAADTGSGEGQPSAEPQESTETPPAGDPK